MFIKKHSLKITDILSPKRETTGSAKSILSDKMAKIYLKQDIKIKKYIEIKIDYNIKNKKIDVKYYLNLQKGSDLYYKDAYLGLRKKERRFFARTYKDCDNLHLKKYSYSIINKNIIKEIIYGKGLFINKNGHLLPSYVTCTTNGYAPVSVVGSFGRYVQGGKFSGKLKYDFSRKTITGNFEVINTIFNNFYVKSAKIIANNKTANISAFGSYLKQNFSCKASVKNGFYGKIIVHNMNLFLDKFNIKHKGQKAKQNKNKYTIKDINKISSKVRDIDMDIENWNIETDTLTMDNIILNDIKLFGSLKDAIFQFEMSELSFAKGVMFAKGMYNFNNNSSCIDFFAKNIDSNMASEMLFNLKNQVQGIANASLRAKTFNNLEDIKAKLLFEIEDGFLPKLANKEFIFKNNKKIKISSLTNADLTKAQALSSDIKGSFDFNNYKLENIIITSRQKSLAMLINGLYDIKQQNADINIYGKYDKQAPKGVKILFVPLDWIINFALRNDEAQSKYSDKLKDIPEIEYKKGIKNQRYFKVDIKGNLNTDNVKVNIVGIQ